MKNLNKSLNSLADRVEAEGLTASTTDAYEKIASANVLLEKIASPLGGFSMKDVPKLLAVATTIATGADLAGKGVDELGKTYENFKYERKKHKEIIPFAKKEHPALKNVSDNKLGNWLDSARAMSPKVSKDKMLAATYLNNVHSLGGQVDIQTASTLSEIGKNTSYNGGATNVAGNFSNAATLLAGV